ncbi:maleylacetoacetate isomerase MaiA [Cordyceps fumosorosea ARSEF 2679]|uniref:Maleylacetoacetate isomerase MaiA n=1 Tax=Cordyceps fumosorosea (strain ARSEF 2679) TaxID=1081104 RepID=A0A167VXH9_CORFA|nr:maleylacetoacetate isomerase MaiA [Cordyceps fumosorosea ARSEF 2679]OAA63089.1 maleylacetoacetate isomerase MaiA [Cordyceps fumosorosea ARSEF 2679]
MPDYTLYTYFRSSCSGRLRIALNLKGIEYAAVPVNLLKGEQASDAHRALNPSATVPLLVAHRDGDLRIGQSMAALEYLDEAHPDVSPLLPADASSRAAARALANIIACDVQPVTNLRILKRLRAIEGADAEAWSVELINEGLRAYEETARGVAGRYSVGDGVSIADVALMPAVWGAERFGISLEAYPTVKRIAANMSALPAVQKAHPFVQPDCPEELRAKS